MIYAGYLLFGRRGRRDLLAPMPRLQDLRDLRLNLLHYFGGAREKPAFERCGYVEKAEFWAVVWGVVVMAATGLILWLPEWATHVLPGWPVGLSEIAHYYEAWLATLAIVVWHPFYVISCPGECPLNLTCLDGRISEEEMIAHHRLEHERLTGSAAAENG